MQLKTLIFTSTLCLVCFTATACSPALRSDDRTRVQGFMNKNPGGPNNNDRGFKNDFQRADLNPNMVTGKNDLYNLSADAQILADMASQVDGVHHARATINGGTANVSVRVNGTTPQDINKIKSRVYNVLKMKFPRYDIHVNTK